MLRDERLQIQFYLEEKSKFDKEPFPNVLLGCAAANITSSIVQTISSLMLLFEVK